MKTLEEELERRGDEREVTDDVERTAEDQSTTTVVKTKICHDNCACICVN